MLNCPECGKKMKMLETILRDKETGVILTASESWSCNDCGIAVLKIKPSIESEQTKSPFDFAGVG